MEMVRLIDDNEPAEEAEDEEDDEGNVLDSN
jgi:hypothetical protein